MLRFVATCVIPLSLEEGMRNYVAKTCMRQKKVAWLVAQLRFVVKPLCVVVKLLLGFVVKLVDVLMKYVHCIRETLSDSLLQLVVRWMTLGSAVKLPGVVSEHLPFVVNISVVNVRMARG